MQTDWLVKALQLNITIITFKEVVNGYDPFSTTFFMLLQTGKGHLYTESLENHFLSDQFIVSVVIPVATYYIHL